MGNKSSKKKDKTSIPTSPKSSRTTEAADIEEIENALFSTDNQTSLVKMLQEEKRPAERKRKRDFFKRFFKKRKERSDNTTTQVKLEFCMKVKDCGHPCKGVAGESQCPPCLDPSCTEAKKSAQ